MTDEEKKKDPIEDLILNMRKGTLITVFYGTYACKGVFIGFKNHANSTYSGRRMHYHSLYNQDISNGDGWINKKLKEWKKGKGRPYISQIHSNAEHRVFSIGKEMLSEYEKEYYNAVKQLI